MSLIVKEDESSFEVLPKGVYQAVCYGVIDLGLQENPFGPPKQQVIFLFEVNKAMNDGTRFGIHKIYNVSAFKKSNLVKDLTSWGLATEEEIKAGFDMSTCKDKNAMISVISEERKDKTYSKIAAIMPIQEGTPAMTPENDGAIPVWVDEKIMKQVKPAEKPADQALAETPADEDLPF